MLHIPAQTKEAFEQRGSRFICTTPINDQTPIECLRAHGLPFYFDEIKSAHNDRCQCSYVREELAADFKKVS
jgi:hypothetical protein